MSCAPVNCCCCGDLLMKQGEITNATVDWTAWLNSQPGYSLFQVNAIAILDLAVANSPPAALTLVDVVPTLATLPVAPDAWVRFVKNQSVLTVKIGALTPVNSYFRLNFTAIARNCDGLQIQRTECLIIRVVACY